MYEILNASYMKHPANGQGICLKKLFEKLKLKEHIGDLLLLFGLVFLLGYGCPIYEICGIPCPCCGVTRAWLAFLHGKIDRAFQYHALFPVVPVLILLYVCREKFSDCWKQRLNVSFCIMGAVMFIYALMRWIGFVDMP